MQIVIATLAALLLPSLAAAQVGAPVIAELRQVPGVTAYAGASTVRIGLTAGNIYDPFGVHTTYLGNNYYPSTNGLWLQNAGMVISGTTFGWGRNSTLLSVNSNGLGDSSRTDAGSMGGFHNLAGRTVYGAADSNLLAFSNRGRAPVATLTGLTEANFTTSGSLYRLAIPAGQYLTAQKVAALRITDWIFTNNGFMGAIVAIDPAGQWIDVDTWTRGAGNKAGCTVRGPAVQPSGFTDCTADSAPLTAWVGTSSTVGISYQLVALSDASSTTAYSGMMGNELGLLSEYTAEPIWSDLNPIAGDNPHSNGYYTWCKADNAPVGNGKCGNGYVVHQGFRRGFVAQNKDGLAGFFIPPDVGSTVGFLDYAPSSTIDSIRTQPSGGLSMFAVRRDGNGSIYRQFQAGNFRIEANTPQSGMAGFETRAPSGTAFKARKNNETDTFTVDMDGSATFAGSVGLGTGSDNELTVAGAVAGAGPTITATGTDTDVTVRVVPKGAGVLEAARVSLGTANGVAAVTNNTQVLQTLAQPTFSGAATAWNNAGVSLRGLYSGTVTSGQVFYNRITSNSDTAKLRDASGGGGTLLYVGNNVSAGHSGGRTGLSVQNVVAGNATYTTGIPWYTALWANSQASASAGGTSGTKVGNVFGALIGAQLLGGAGLYWTSSIGQEIDMNLVDGTGATIKVGQQIIQLETDAVSGTLEDAAFVVANQINGTAPGWDILFSIGSRHGWWPGKSTSTLFGTQTATTAGGPAMAAAHGVDLSAVTFSADAFKSAGFTVDGAGAVSTTKLQVTMRTPASASAACVAGEIAADATYLYSCVGTNSWHRVANGAAW